MKQALPHQQKTSTHAYFSGDTPPQDPNGLCLNYIKKVFFYAPFLSFSLDYPLIWFIINNMKQLRIGKDEYVTINEAAKILGVSTMTMHNWDKRKKLSPTARHPVNGYRLYRVSSLKKILNKIHSAS